MFPGTLPPSLLWQGVRCDYTLRTATTALWPPKPKELLSATMLPAGRSRGGA